MAIDELRQHKHALKQVEEQRGGVERRPQVWRQAQQNEVQRTLHKHLKQEPEEQGTKWAGSGLGCCHGSALRLSEPLDQTAPIQHQIDEATDEPEGMSLNPIPVQENGKECDNKDREPDGDHATNVDYLRSIHVSRAAQANEGTKAHKDPGDLSNHK